VVASILGWIVIGMVVGLLAWRISPGRDLAGLIATSLIAVAGALVAGLVDRQLGHHQLDAGIGWIAATLGAIVLLAVYRLFMRSRENP
jgi:uncharacterized membrane protein YeaQ/YmgE (transglycosylase-associated protein family)